VSGSHMLRGMHEKPVVGHDFRGKQWGMLIARQMKNLVISENFEPHEYPTAFVVVSVSTPYGVHHTLWTGILPQKP